MKKFVLCLFVCLFFMGCSSEIKDGNDLYVVSSVMKNYNSDYDKKYISKLYIEGEWISCVYTILLYTNEDIMPGDRFKLVNVGKDK